MNAFTVRALVAVLSQWDRYQQANFPPEPRVEFRFQGQPAGMQGRFWVKNPKIALSGVFFSFEQALEAAHALLSQGLLHGNEGNYLLSKASELPIFTSEHPFAYVFPRGPEVLNEVFFDSQAEARKRWPR